jgi:hypothetical protein
MQWVTPAFPSGSEEGEDVLDRHVGLDGIGGGQDIAAILAENLDVLQGLALDLFRGCRTPTAR